MGLAASQARLLSLTSRQHTIEANAQRLLSDKMRLSNNSEAAYQQYMNALDETTLKTRQVNDVGETFWIDGSINNLMRYNASDNTSGSIFFVQDLETSELYVPKDVLDKYNNYTATTVPIGHEYSDDMKFATLFGVEYNKVDKNADIKIKYDLAVSKGWNTALTDEQYYAYIEALGKDQNIQETAKVLKNQIPNGKSNVQFKDMHGNVLSTTDAYKIDPRKEAVVTNYENLLNKILGSEVQKAAYSDASIAGNSAIALLQESLNILNSISPNLPQAQTTQETYSGPELPAGTIDWKTISYTTTKMSAGIASTDSSGNPVIYNPYLKVEDGSYTFSEDQKFEMMLNGGTILWEGIEKTNYLLYSRADTETPATPIRTDIYSANTNSILAQRGATNMATALSALFDRMATSTKYSNGVLTSIGKSETDIANYRKFKEAEEAYSLYTPEYEYIPTDNVKAAYYETIFKAIEAAGGCIGVSDEQAKNTTWVENMIKNAKVILTTWDNSENTLSRTAPALHVDVKEVSDDRKVAQAESDYEAEMAFINEKDTKIDNILNKLETERTSIKTEIDGIQKVMQDNVSVNFKVFS